MNLLPFCPSLTPAYTIIYWFGPAGGCCFSVVLLPQFSAVHYIILIQNSMLLPTPLHLLLRTVVEAANALACTHFLGSIMLLFAFLSFSIFPLVLSWCGLLFSLAKHNCLPNFGLLESELGGGIGGLRWLQFGRGKSYPLQLLATRFCPYVQAVCCQGDWFEPVPILM